ncbi:hypothetical protein JCM18909_658 [Cutibacterium acnes JCM 18909]|nr:hypothetical protein JCM18909_658 [Cutibacterium acnes JCM 18909]
MADPRPSRLPVGHGRATDRGIDHRWIRRRLIGVVAPYRAILHDAMGSTEIDVPALIDTIPDDKVFPSAEDELSALDTVASLGNAHLSQLCDGVRKKTVFGCNCWSRATHHACPHTVGRVFCADIDRTGLTSCTSTLTRRVRCSYLWNRTRRPSPSWRPPWPGSP